MAKEDSRLKAKEDFIQLARDYRPHLTTLEGFCTRLRSNPKLDVKTKDVVNVAHGEIQTLLHNLTVIEEELVRFEKNEVVEQNILYEEAITALGRVYLFIKAFPSRFKETPYAEASSTGV